MGGFGTVVGFMFSFFIMMFLLLGSFYIYQYQVNENLEVINNVESRYVDSVLSQYSLSSPYYASGRIYFTLENGDNAKLTYSKDNQQCFDFFIGSTFISQEDYKIAPLGDASASYTFIDQSRNGYASILASDSTYGSQVNVKAISCGGVEYFYTIGSEQWDWWNEDWTERLSILATNPSTSDLTEYQLQIDLNSSYLDFSQVTEDELRVILPLKEQYVLDITFDEYGQTLNDHSKYDNFVGLGFGGTSDPRDPTFQDNGVISNAISLDGGDWVRITSDASLELETEVTYSLWVKWDATGDNLQYLYTNGGSQNSLSIVNDGGVNDDKVAFSLNISGTQRTIYSSSTLLLNDWTHITGTFDGTEMRLYLDGQLESNQSYSGDINSISSTNFLGTSGSGDSFFTGDLDEVKILDIALSSQEVQDVFENNLKFRELDFHVSFWNQIEQEGTLFIKQPYLGAGNNVTLQLYYSPLLETQSESDIYDTFSYKYPRTVGYVVNDRIASTTGLNIMSLYDNNLIEVQDDSFTLDEQQSTTLGSGSISASDEVRMKSLAMVEGNGDATEIIVPLSWAGTDFVTSGLREGTDRICMLSPWGTASYEIFGDGVSLATGSVTDSGACVDVSIGSGSNARVTADIPILVANVPTNQDAIIFYPATSRSLYGLPSQQLYIAASTAGASGTIYESDGTISPFSLGSLAVLNQGGNGADAGGPAFVIQSDNPIGAIQQADGEGTESTTFVPEVEFGTLFGSAYPVEHLAVFSSNLNANCTSYDSIGSLIDNIATGTGSNGIYKYGFGTGSDTLYTGGDWKLECDKPVWLYFEQDTDSDERMPFGHLQMRQYVYPEPTISIN